MWGCMCGTLPEQPELLGLYIKGGGLVISRLAFGSFDELIVPFELKFSLLAVENGAPF